MLSETMLRIQSAVKKWVMEQSFMELLTQMDKRLSVLKEATSLLTNATIRVLSPTGLQMKSDCIT
jgi:hypothetical protein